MLCSLEAEEPFDIVNVCDALVSLVLVSLFYMVFFFLSYGKIAAGNVLQTDSAS